MQPFGGGIFNNDIPGAADIITGGIPNCVYEFTTPDDVAQAYDDAFQDCQQEIAAVQAQIAQKRALIGRLQVGGSRANIATAQSAIVDRESELRALRVKEERLFLEFNEAEAQAAAATVQPFNEKFSSVSCFDSTGTDFIGSTFFDFPVARFPAGAAPRYWQGTLQGDGTYADVFSPAKSYNYASVACTPFLFQRNQDGSIPAAKLAGGLALAPTTVPTCIMSVHDAGGSSSRVQCDYDFTNTMSVGAGYNTTTGAAGDKFFTAGYSFYLDRTHPSSNVVDTYFTEPTIVATQTAAQMRQRFGARQYIGNAFPVSDAQLDRDAVAGHIQNFRLYDHIFATAKKPSGILFRTRTATAVAPAAARVYMMYCSVPDEPDALAAELRYTTNAGGINAARIYVTLSNPVCVDANNATATVPFPLATFNALKQANVAWDMILLDEDFVQADPQVRVQDGPADVLGNALAALEHRTHALGGANLLGKRTGAVQVVCLHKVLIEQDHIPRDVCCL